MSPESYVLQADSLPLSHQGSRWLLTRLDSVQSDFKTVGFLVLSVTCSRMFMLLLLGLSASVSASVK